jgi:hypothetical protein
MSTDRFAMRMIWRMSDDKPNPFDDLRKGLGLLFRAAKTTIEKLPKTDLEEVVVTSAREVGRAIESVGKAIEREVFGKKEGRPGAGAPFGGTSPEPRERGRNDDDGESPGPRERGRDDEQRANDAPKPPDRHPEPPKPGDSTPPNAA